MAGLSDGDAILLGVVHKPVFSRNAIAYLAGIIDGDGGIYLSAKNKGGTPTVTVTINSTTVELMDWIVALAGGKYREARRWTKTGDPSRIGSKPCYSWHATGERGRIIVRAIAPHLIVKRARADLVLEGWDQVTLAMTRPGRRLRHVLEAREDLLKRGWPKTLVGH